MLYANQGLVAWFRSRMSDMGDLLYPPDCIGCGRTTHAKLPVCLPCSIRYDQPLPGEVLTHIHDKIAGSSIANAFALWIFEKDGPVQRIHRELKYGNRPYHGKILGQLIGRSLARLLSTLAEATDDRPPNLPLHVQMPRPEIVVPIPLHQSRFLERGYNQSLSIANGIGDALQLPVNDELLRRIKRTRSQTNLSIRARSDNIAGAFECSNDEFVVGRDLLVVDDVITTGATVSEAASVLTRAGARSVSVAALGFARV